MPLVVPPPTPLHRRYRAHRLCLPLFHSTTTYIFYTVVPSHLVSPQDLHVGLPDQLMPPAKGIESKYSKCGDWRLYYSSIYGGAPPCWSLALVRFRCPLGVPRHPEVTLYRHAPRHSRLRLLILRSQQIEKLQRHDLDGISGMLFLLFSVAAGIHAILDWW